MQAPWDIYAHRLLHLGHGHPLWGPEPSERFGEVRLGDVGYLQEGRFCFLFNAMRSGDDPINSRGVPLGFAAFKLPDSDPVHWPNAITETELYSKSLRSVDIAASLSVSEVAASASAGLRYQCSEDSGAFLLLKRPAHKTFLDCQLLIEKYMETHLDSWCEFANDRLGIGLKDRDIIFISGFMKTTMWAEAAFSDTTRSCELVIAGGCFVPSASGDFRVSISRGLASVESRNGPRDRVSTWKDDSDHEHKYDQCIFLNYYKMKKRDILRRPRVMRAAARPHKLPDNDDNDDYDTAPNSSSSPAPSSTDSQESDHVGKSYDPVNDVLDYILKDPTVEAACASDYDLSSLFGASGIPNDLQTALETLTPQVTRRDRGIGTIHPLAQRSDKGNAPNADGVLSRHTEASSPSADQRKGNDKILGYSPGRRSSSTAGRSTGSKSALRVKRRSSNNASTPNVPSTSTLVSAAGSAVRPPQSPAAAPYAHSSEWTEHASVARAPMNSGSGGRWGHWRVQLNNYIQRNGLQAYVYWAPPQQSGPSGAPIWTVSVYFNQNEYGRGSSTRVDNAKEIAAEQALRALWIQRGA